MSPSRTQRAEFDEGSKKTAGSAQTTAVTGFEEDEAPETRRTRIDIYNLHRNSQDTRVPGKKILKVMPVPHLETNSIRKYFLFWLFILCRCLLGHGIKLKLHFVL